MSKLQTIKKAKLQSKLHSALEKLYELDSFLLRQDVNVHERSVTHRLAVHMNPEFPEYHIDCEYNVIHDEENGKFLTKRIWKLKQDKKLDSEYLKEVSVFPDIIVHRRGEAANLLAIEVKMVWKSNEKNQDLVKLQAYREALKYDYAIYLELGETSPSNIVWI